MAGVAVVLYIHLDRDIGISQFDIQKVRNHELKQSASQLNYHWYSVSEPCTKQSYSYDFEIPSF